MLKMCTDIFMRVDQPMCVYSVAESCSRLSCFIHAWLHQCISPCQYSYKLSSDTPNLSYRFSHLVYVSVCTCTTMNVKPWVRFRRQVICMFSCVNLAVTYLSLHTLKLTCVKHTSKLIKKQNEFKTFDCQKNKILKVS